MQLMEETISREFRRPVYDKKHTQAVDIVHVCSWESGCDAKCDALFPARHNYDSAGVYQHRRYAVRTPAHPWRDLHQRCVRCENQPPKGVETATNPRESDGGIDAGEAGGMEPPRRLMRAAMRSEPRAVVRSTLPQASTVRPERVQGAVRSSVRGEAGTSDARSAKGDARSASVRPTRRGERCCRTLRRRWQSSTRRGASEPPAKRSAE